MHLDVLAFQSGTSCEFYMCARPEEGEDARAEAKAMYGAIADYVKGHQLRICRERAFVPHGAMAEFAAERSAAYGKDLAAVAPTWLGGAANVAPGGIQVHAVRGPKDWKPLQGQHGQVGWTFSEAELIEKLRITNYVNKYL